MTYRAGGWKAQCQRCGVWFKNGQLKKEWSGLRVCSGPGSNDCWDYRHPQERLRVKPDYQAIPWASPDTDGPDVSVGSGNQVEPGDL